MTDRMINGMIFAVTLVLVIRFFRENGKWNPGRGKAAFRFFTTLSNVLCAVSALLMCIAPENRLFRMLKYIGTAAVTVTMMTVLLFLAPTMGGLRKLIQGAELFLHLLTPLAALLTFGLWERRGMAFGEALWGMLPVALYGPYYLYRTVFAPEGKRWEDFYGFNRGGKWPASFLAMLAGTLLICLGLMGLQNIRG